MAKSWEILWKYLFDEIFSEKLTGHVADMRKILNVILSRFIDQRFGGMGSLIVKKYVVLQGGVKAARRASRPSKRVVHRTGSVLGERIHHP